MWRLTDYPADKIEADVIVAGLYTRREMDESSFHLARRMGGFVFEQLEAARLSFGEAMLVTPPAGWKTPWVLWLGMGDAGSFYLNTLEEVLKEGCRIMGEMRLTTPCFTLLGEGSSTGLSIAKLAETIITKTPFRSGEIFHPRREVLYKLFAALPNRFYYRLWTQEERRRA